MDTQAREIQFTLNGRRVTALVESHLDLVDLLRRYQLFGARESCGQGLCGCCTAIVDGQAVSGCLTLAQLVALSHGTLRAPSGRSEDQGVAPRPVARS